MRLGACGDRCDVCPRFVATETNDTHLFRKIMRLYVKAGLRKDSDPIESLQCRGCSPKNACAYQAVRDCAWARKKNNCGECSEYPCQKIRDVFQRAEIAQRTFIELCSKDEFALFEEAFFRKKMYLDEVAKQRRQ